MRLIPATAFAYLVLAGPAAAQQPLGIVDGTLARFDPDTLMPAGPEIEAAETHTLPVLGPDGSRFALGVSESDGPGGRVGLWIGDTSTPAITHRVQAGIAAEAVVFPGIVAALLQDGRLIVVDPASGKIRSRKRVGWSQCAREGVHAAGRGVIVNEVRSNGAEVVIVDSRGRVSTRFVRLRPAARRCVALVAHRDRAYIVGADRVAVLDPATRAITTHTIASRPTTAAAVPQGLVVAGAGGARLYDTVTWRARWHDRPARSVLASGDTVVATGNGVRALDAATGRVLWRAPGSAAAVAAGRVYAQPAVLDLNTGERRGTHPVPNTRLRLVDVPRQALHSQAAWPFERVATLSSDGEIDVRRGVVYAADRRPSLRAFPLDGRPRRLALPRGTQSVGGVRTSSRALLVFVAGPDWPVAYGQLGGPLRRLRRDLVSADVTGSTLLTVEKDRRWVYAQDVGGGPRRRVARLGGELFGLQAAGDYAAVYLDSDGRRVGVIDLRSGRVLYRVRVRGTAVLTSTGRVYVRDDEFERIQTASPAHPRLRTIARVYVEPFGLAPAGDRLIFSERLGDTTNRMVLLGADGRRRALTARMRRGTDVAYDGTTLAFTAGNCVFAGPLPDSTATGAPPEDCYPPE